MYYIRIFAHKIAPIKNGEVGEDQFRALLIAEQTGEILAKMFSGTTDCMNTGVVQSTDRIILNSPITKSEGDLIERAYPFVSCSKAIDPFADLR